MMSLQPSLHEAAKILAARRAARRNLLDWAKLALEPIKQQPAAHHELLLGELQRIAEGQNDRLMIFMPPGSAKSTYASVLFPAWYLHREPRLCVIGASHTATLAETFSRRVQNTVREFPTVLEYGLRTESAERWETDHSAEYRAVGIGGPIAGTRADLAIIDDPVKSRADAESETLREKTWNWFNADLRTRLKPSGKIVLIMTRWHEDDLGGRLLEVEPERWKVVKLPAFATDENDALGREIGAPLWSDGDYGYSQYRYSGIQLELSQAGNWVGDQKVEQTITWEGSTRTKLQ